MAKIKSDKIPHYELLYIVSNKFTENEVKDVSEKVNKTIKDNGGQNLVCEEWGKRKLAYPIKNFTHGYYNLVEFDVTGDRINKINDTLRLASEILRFQIIVKEVRKEKGIKKEKKKERKSIDVIKKEKEDKEKIITKVDLKDLDEKLDKILDTDDLL